MIPLLIATTNRGKRFEVHTALAGVGVDLVTLETFAGLAPPKETGQTFQENAALKATYYASATGLLTLAEDSGLDVEALGGAPGVHSARFGGEGLSDEERCRLVLAAVDAQGTGVSRAARFTCAVAVADGSRILFEALGTVEGTIARSAAGSRGFGYDPIFYYEPFGCTFAEAGDRKALVSHRTKALAALGAWLPQWLIARYDSGR